MEMHLMTERSGKMEAGQFRGATKGLRLSAVFLVALASLLAGGCTTTKRAADLVIDHHLGMVRGAMDILSGEAEAREQRVAKLGVDLEQSRAALDAEQDQSRLVEQLRQHVALQGALIAELQQGHGGHGHLRGEHQQAQAETEGSQEPHQH